MKLYISLLIGLFIVSSCELDNYKGPDAKLYGAIYDNQTNELIQQDVINGSQIEYTELGWGAIAQFQYMIFKADGTYRNDMMFAGEYSIRPRRGNFVDPPVDTVTIVGETKLDWSVQPFIRIKDCTIAKVDTAIVATFRVEQTVTTNVIAISLFASIEPSLGANYSQVKTVQNINAVVAPATVYTLKIYLAANSSVLKPGNSYFFRVGALISNSGAKYNYAPAVRIDI